MYVRIVHEWRSWTGTAGEVEAAAQQIRLITPGDPGPPNQDKVKDETAQVLAVTSDDPKPPNQEEQDPGKAQTAHSAKTETRATL